jgi:hypothetical protein
MLEFGPPERLRRNNLLFAYAVMIVLFVSSLWLDWFVQIFDAPHFQVIPIRGTRASLEMLFRCPVWFLLLCSSLSSLAVALNFAGITKIHRRVPIVVLAICGGFFSYGIWSSAAAVHSQIGIWIALLTTAVALGGAFIPPAGRVSDPRRFSK